MAARYLIDKSALSRMQVSGVRERIAPLIEAGEAATCTTIDLEVLFSVRNHEEHERTRLRRSLAYASVPIDHETLKRAIEIQGELAKNGRHRVPIPALIIAAAAEAAGIAILHYDRNFEIIAEVTGQPVEWVVERGSV